LFYVFFVYGCKVSEKSAKLYRFASPFMNIFAAEGYKQVDSSLC